jgi:cytidyltransferase-like protein
MVDMSATLLHHGHVRLLQAASRSGTVVVGLATDDEILQTKGYEPELSFEERKEILLSIRYVEEVVPAPWLITDSFLDEHRINFLMHGADNQNAVSQDRLRILPRTEGVSSSQLRARVLCAVGQKMLRSD